MVAHAIDPSSQERQRKTDICEFKASPTYAVTSRPARAT